MKRNSWIIITLLLVFVACRKELEYEGNGKKPLLVLNAIVENDSLFRVYLERTVFFLSSEVDTAKYIYSGATIKVTNVNSGEVFTMTQASKGSMYEFPFTVKPYTNYKVEVTHPDYPTISSEMTSVGSISFTSIDTISVPSQNEYESYLKTNIKWKDPIGENYYMLRVRYTYVSGTGDGYGNSDYYVGMLSNDPSIDNSENTDVDGSVYPSSDLLFNDKLFEGQDKNIEFLFNRYKSYDTTGIESHTVSLITMNKETYLYYVSMKKNSSMDFFSEPVKVYSNILNGFGIFGTLGYSNWKL